MNPHHGDLVLSGDSIRASPNLYILGVKFDLKHTFEDHVLVLLYSFRELLCWGWWNKHLWTPLCYFVAILHLFSQSLSIVLRCGGQLLNVIFSFLSDRCIQWLGFALIKVSGRCVIDVMLLGLVCRTRLMRTLITIYSASFHLLLLEFDILELRPLEFEESWCRPSQFARCFLPAMVRIWNDLPYTLFWMGSRVQSTIGCFPMLSFLQFSVAQVLVGLLKQFINNFVFPALACAVGFNNNKLHVSLLFAALLYRCKRENDKIMCPFPLTNPQTQ